MLRAIVDFRWVKRFKDVIILIIVGFFVVQFRVYLLLEDYLDDFTT